MTEVGFHILQIPNSDQSRADITTEDRVDCIVTKSTPLLPEIFAPKMTRIGGYCHSRGSARFGGGVKSTRPSHRGERR